MEENNTNTDNHVSEDTMWYLNNYIVLRDYLDRTISRIAARCVRSGNIAMEEYPFYGYILDVLEEICDTGDFIMEHRELHPYVEKKIAGGLKGLKKDLQDYKLELKSNASPDMIKEDESDLEKMKKTLAFDPTAGAGESMDEIVNKILKSSSTELNSHDDTEEFTLSPRQEEKAPKKPDNFNPNSAE